MSTLRSRAFWALDSLRGGKVAKEYKDIRQIMDGETDIDSLTDLRCAELLRHATENVPYYSGFTGRTLEEFPVAHKALINKNGNDMIARNCDRNSLHRATTSGSTGIPFQVFQDARKRNRAQAEVLYWGALAGYQFGSRLFYLKNWSDRNKLTRFAQFARNTVPVDIMDMQDQDFCRLFAQMAGDRDMCSILGHSSGLERLGSAVKASESNQKSLVGKTLVAIIGQAEGMSSEARKMLAETFGCMPYLRYGMEELGILGQQMPASDERYLINRATYLVEVLKEDCDDAASPGQLGRIVVTDLFNYGQPMIRYDTGDVGALGVHDDGSTDKRWFILVEGRKLDQIYDVNDRALSSLLMYKIWWKFPDIKQYQVVQRGRGDYLLRLNVSPDFQSDRSVIQAFSELVGGGNVELERTDEPLVYSSGKRKAVVNLSSLPENDMFDA